VSWNAVQHCPFRAGRPEPSKSVASGDTNVSRSCQYFPRRLYGGIPGLPQVHPEADLHRALLDKLRGFLIELGRDFCFVGSEYPLQVGGRDFALDLLFFHRGLNCLVAIELKVSEFEPEYLGKLNF
jgi:hypothetical protein